MITKEDAMSDFNLNNGNNNPYDQSNNNPYGQQPYGNQPYGQQPYGQQPYNQQNQGFADLFNTPLYAQQASGSYGQGGGSGYGSGVYSADEISPQKYNMVIGGCLLYGFLINLFMVAFCYDACANLISGNPILFLVVYLGMVIAGGIMVHKSTKPAISFIGYNLFVVPLGICLSYILNVYAMAGYNTAITIAFGITAVVTLAMMAAANIFPQFFLSLGKTLFVTLMITVVVELVAAIFFGTYLSIIDYIVVIIFCGYIGYDWAKANALPKTVDNAIDSAAELYVDIVNLFIRILRIVARAQNN